MMRKVPMSRVIVFNNNAEVLLIKPQGIEDWRLPQAALEDGETADKSCFRAAAEDANIRLLDVECIGYSSGTHEQMLTLTNECVNYHALIFVSTLWETLDKNLASIGSQVAWFSMAERPPLNAQMSATFDLLKTWLDHRQFVIR